MAHRSHESLVWGISHGKGLGALNVIDPTGLAEHVRVCRESQAGWSQWHCAVEGAQGFFASRVVTTGLLLVILVAMALAVA